MLTASPQLAHLITFQLWLTVVSILHWRSSSALRAYYNLLYCKRDNVWGFWLPARNHIQQQRKLTYSPLTKQDMIRWLKGIREASRLIFRWSDANSFPVFLVFFAKISKLTAGSSFIFNRQMWKWHQSSLLELDEKYLWGKKKVTHAYPLVVWSTATVLNCEAISALHVIQNTESTQHHFTDSWSSCCCLQLTAGRMTQCISEPVFSQKSHRSSHKRLSVVQQSGLKLKTESTFTFISSDCGKIFTLWQIQCLFHHQLKTLTTVWSFRAT